MLVSNLVGEREATHTGLDAKDVVVGREHVHGGRSNLRRNWGDRNLRVVDAREVAGTSWLVLLWLERERVRVDTGAGGASVVLVGLDLVEVLTLLLLEAVLAVEDKLEFLEGTGDLLRIDFVTTIGAELEEGGTLRSWGNERIGSRDGLVGLNNDVRAVRTRGEVPKGGGVAGDVREAPHELLDGVVVREADLLGGIDSVDTSVLHLLDEVLVALLGEATTLLGVEVDVVRPDLEGVGVEVGTEVGRKVKVDADLVVLEGDEGEVETWVAVEEEDEGEVDSLCVRRGGHLTPRKLLRLIQVKLGVHAPPLLVVLVDALTTDGKLNVVDRTLRDPARDLGVGRRFDLSSRYMSPTRSPLRATVTDTRPPPEAVPLTVCSMFSIAKLVWRLYFAWKKVTSGLPVR